MKGGHRTDMAINEMTSAACSLIDQPIIITKGKIVSYMNKQAVILAGNDMTGKNVGQLLPTHIINTQAPEFTATAFIGMKNCTVKARTVGGSRLYALTVTSPVNDDLVAGPDLRSSLANIRLASDCILKIADERSDASLAGYVRTIDHSYYRLKHIVDNSMTMKKLQSGQLTMMNELVDLKALCRNTINIVKRIYIEKNINLRLNAADDMCIYGNPALLKQLLMNLLSNSVANTDNNGRIVVSLLRTEKNMILTVDDDGKGIPEDNLPFVFECYRHDEMLTGNSGTGMGFSIVRGIAELHNGAVIIESRGEGKGTLVRVMLANNDMAGQIFRSSRITYETDGMIDVLTQFAFCLPTDFFNAGTHD